MDLDWIDANLPTPRTGAVEVVKDRPWSMVARIPTVDATLYFKENRNGTCYEAALLPALARWLPGRVLAPLAADVRRGWTLLPDGGPVLRETTRGDLDHWRRLLAEHARLQRDLAPHVDELLALGVPDHRPSALPSNLDRLPASPALDEARRELVELNETIARSPIPLSLQHDDLHDGNVFADGRVFDWGDASVGHPFGVLLVTLRVAADQVGVAEDDPVLHSLRDAYLEPWSDLADRATLLRDVAAAVQLAKVGRSLSWQRALDGADEAAWSEWGDGVTGWLDELRHPVAYA